jgi:hypothetical protein
VVVAACCQWGWGRWGWWWAVGGDCDWPTGGPPAHQTRHQLPARSWQGAGPAHRPQGIWHMAAGTSADCRLQTAAALRPGRPAGRLYVAVAPWRLQNPRWVGRSLDLFVFFSWRAKKTGLYSRKIEPISRRLACCQISPAFRARCTAPPPPFTFFLLLPAIPVNRLLRDRLGPKLR